MLVIKDLNKTFNTGTVNEKKAIDNVSLTINDGDFITVIGGNGAGKSTLLNLISGTYMSDSGSIVLNDQDITKLKEYKRASMIGRVFQDPMTGTCKELTIEENFSLALRRGQNRTLKKGITSKEKDIPVELNFLGIRDNRHYPNELFWQVAGEVGCPDVFGFDAHNPLSAFDNQSFARANELVNKFNLNYIGKPDIILIQEK